jgi:hypothetical protein
LKRIEKESNEKEREEKKTSFLTQQKLEKQKKIDFEAF